MGKKGIRPSLQGLKKKYPAGLLDLLREMWQEDPEKRPGMLEVVHRLSEMMR